MSVRQPYPVSAGGSGSGDVTAAASFGTDNVLIRSDGVGKGVQATNISVDDSGNVTLDVNATLFVSTIEDVGASNTIILDDAVSGITIEAASNPINLLITSGIAVTIGSVGLGIGEDTPTSKLHLTTNSIGTTQSSAYGIFLSNETAAAAGAQQMSPPLIFSGYGWKAAATAASQLIQCRIDLLPVQANPAASGTFQIAFALNGGAFANAFTLTSAGTATCANITITSISSNTSAFSVSNVGLAKFQGIEPNADNTYYLGKVAIAIAGINN